jgi:hypothetical protein
MAKPDWGLTAAEEEAVYEGPNHAEHRAIFEKWAAATGNDEASRATRQMRAYEAFDRRPDLHGLTMFVAALDANALPDALTDQLYDIVENKRTDVDFNDIRRRVGDAYTAADEAYKRIWKDQFAKAAADYAAYLVPVQRPATAASAPVAPAAAAPGQSSYQNAADASAATPGQSSYQNAADASAAAPYGAATDYSGMPPREAPAAEPIVRPPATLSDCLADEGWTVAFYEWLGDYSATAYFDFLQSLEADYLPSPTKRWATHLFDLYVNQGASAPLPLDAGMVQAVVDGLAAAGDTPPADLFDHVARKALAELNEYYDSFVAAYAPVG